MCPEAIEAALLAENRRRCPARTDFPVAHPLPIIRRYVNSAPKRARLARFSPAPPCFKEGPLFALGPRRFLLMDDFRRKPLSAMLFNSGGSRNG